MSLTKAREEQLNKLCNTFRKDVIKTLYARQTGHPGGSLSVCEILTAVYFEHTNVDPKDPKKADRDRVVLCKGHAAPMLYRVLAEKGFFPVEEMATLRTLNTRLQGHPCSNHTPGVDVSTGPLGVGLAASLGIAIGTRMRGYDSYTYAILGDGELNEGTVWETAMSAYKFKADNLIAIVDNNRVQLDGTCEEIMPPLDIGQKFASFGWNVICCDGHDISALCDAIALAKRTKGVPNVIIAHTVKGKGVSFMEGKNTWHGKAIGKEDFEIAMRELEGVK